MRLKALHEQSPLHLGMIDPKLRKKMQDPGRPSGYTGDYMLGPDKVRGQVNNPAIKRQRHREYMNTPPDGAGAETKTDRKKATMKTERPTPSKKFGRDLDRDYESDTTEIPSDDLT